MLNGNISNQIGTSILINIESIFKIKEKTSILDKVQTLIKGITSISKIDTNNLAYVVHLVKNTDIAVTLVSDNTKLVEELKDDPILNCKVLNLDYATIGKYLDIKLYDYYLDDDLERVNKVNRLKALTIEEFKKLGVK